MFTLEDGREQLYQWDLNRRIIVNDPKICEVHFCNRTSDCSLVVEVYTDDTYDGKTYADIPNILLQDARPIRAYAYCDDKYTLTEQQFSVKARTQPSDYVYTETDVVRWDVIAESAEKALAAAEELKEYFDTHTLEVTDDGEGNVTLEATIPEGGGSGGDIDLSNYYTKEEIDNKGFLTEHQSLEGYAKITDIPDVSKYQTEEQVTALINDALAGIATAEGGSY